MVSFERIVAEEDPAVICLVETHLGEDEEIELTRSITEVAIGGTANMVLGGLLAGRTDGFP